MSGDGKVRNLGGEESEARFQHRDIDVLALAGVGALEQGGRDGECGGHAGQHVAHRETGTSGAHFLVAGQRHDAGQRLDLAVVAGLVAIGTGAAEAGDGAIDQAGIDRAEGVVADAEAIHHAGAEVLHHHVGARDEAVDDVDCGRLLQIEREAAFVAVDRQPRRRHASVGPFAGEGRAAHVLALTTFDLDDVGAEQGKLVAAVGAGEDLGEV